MGMVIFAVTVTEPEERVSSSWHGETQPSSVAIAAVSNALSTDEMSPARVTCPE